MNLTAKRLRALLSYDSKTGLFKWRAKPSGRGGTRRKSLVAGCLCHGYVRITINGRQYAAHRLAWLYVHGKWPKRLDHVNRKRADNRWHNLREATVPENGWNARKHVDNTSGFKGVHLHPNLKARPWQARISVNKRRLSLGYFETPETAHAIYCAAAKHHHGRFARMD